MISFRRVLILGAVAWALGFADLRPAWALPGIMQLLTISTGSTDVGITGNRPPGSPPDRPPASLPVPGPILGG